MRRLLAAAVALVVLTVSAAGSFHRHAANLDEGSCAVCAVNVQARSAPSAAPVLSVARTSVVVVVKAERQVDSVPAFAVPARAPPSVA